MPTTSLISEAPLILPPPLCWYQTPPPYTHSSLSMRGTCRPEGAVECVIRLTQIFKCKWERERGRRGRDGERWKWGRVRDWWGVGRFMKRLIWGLAGRPCAKNWADLLKVSVYWTGWMRSFRSIQRDTFCTLVPRFFQSIDRQPHPLRHRLILSFILHVHSLKRKRRKSWQNLESRLAFSCRTAESLRT